ncbi:Linear gramicidin synthase subunit B [Hartmannibacter diazotrophicus]|uniref:Linear gramicidin synthase subunit B n=1 Tax=Hartmannibacter diazotrophicus TaxID=1482074 RepID=A0A2C9D923_9HYPH|nr:non-ribosomal peptide synthetase [Hartmannibacter diazotrophicus]SON56670.1 Linear gramicidin synthase subunit B [Hartmannibacter diazotrophicus]
MNSHSSAAATPSPALLPLSPIQATIWARAQIAQTEPFAIQTIALRLPGEADDLAIETALRRLMDHHAVLSCRLLRLAGGRSGWTPDRAAPLPLHIGKPATGDRPADAALAELQAAALQPFDLETAAPIRFHLSRISPDETVLILSAHPIVADPAAMAILAEDLCTALAGKPLLQPVVEAASTPDQIEEKLAYWRGLLLSETAAAGLPQRYRPGSSDAGRDSASARIPATLMQAVEHTADVMSLGIEDIWFAALAGLMHRYTGQERFRLGLVAVNRTDRAISRVEDLLPIDLAVTSSLTYADIAAAGRSARAIAEANRVRSDVILQDLLTLPGQEENALVKVALDLRRLPTLDVSSQAGVVALPAPSAHADVTVTVLPAVDGAADIVVEGRAGVFEPALIARFAEQLKRVLEAIAEDPRARLSEVQFVGFEDLAALSAPYPDDAVDDDRPVHQIIADHAVLTPEKTAIIYGDEVWTHRELDERANRLAHRLIGLGVEAETTVAILVERSAHTVMAILAVLKAGGAYIPVEPDHPPARNHHILKDAKVKVVITANEWRSRLPDDFEAAIVELDRLDLAGEPASAPDVAIHPDQLAYVMYTSGSTGLPKGVAVEHGPLTHHNQATSRVYEMSSESRELPFLPFSSDGGHERWMVPLMEGGSILIPSAALWTPGETLAAMRRHGANNASIPTTYMQQLAEWAERTGEAPPMRLYSFGGEGLPQATFDLLSRSLNAKILINGYGPTETIMTPMVWKVRLGVRFSGAYAPIGRAVGRRRVYVLDPDMNPCPIGVTGELYLGGEGVARGYFGKPGVTADRFVPDPFGPLFGEEGGRLYRSGDLTRWREDGTVEFVGRVDLQVKLRGFRIELGEIEAALLAEDGVGEALVLLREDDGEKALVAYAVPEAGRSLDDAVLMAALKRRLPGHMVPVAVIVLEKMPTNPNAKLDRSALPRPQRKLREIVPPATDLERLLVGIWQEILGIEAVGVTESFFDVGGHSLAALRILGALRAVRSGDRTTIADLFNNPTIRALAGAIEKGGQSTGQQAVALRASGSRPMLYCFPGLLVSTREYLRLVDHLGPDQPATGFMCHSLSEQKDLNVSVEDVVAPYVEHILKTSRGKPCAFLGWSWGGLLAFEAARLLGSEIDLKMIGMVDVCDLGSDFALGAVPEFAPGEREELEQQVSDWLSRTAMRREWDALLSVMDSLAYDQFLKFVGNEKEPLPVDGPDISSREHTFWVLIDNALVFRRHEIRPHDCRIHSFTAEDSLSRGLTLIDWRRFSALAQPVEMVSGTNHLHIIGAPQFQERFAQRLGEAFERDSRS